jgi:hypothetical protein
MDGRLVDLAKKGKEGLLMLAELSQHAAVMGEMGNLYAERYLQKGAYRETAETGIQWVMKCMKRPRYIYKMFRMSPEIFHALHDLLVSTYGLSSTYNVSSIESLAMFLWIVGGPQSFAQVENRFTRSLWTVHIKFYEVLKCLRKLTLMTKSAESNPLTFVKPRSTWVLTTKTSPTNPNDHLDRVHTHLWSTLGQSHGQTTSKP